MLKINLLNYQKKRGFTNNEDGMALIEALPVLFLMAVFFNISLGFFGAIHSGILNSIGSYNYAIETFRYRSNLIYFRPGDMKNYKTSKNRVHGVVKDGSDEDDLSDKTKWPSTVRPITFNYSKTDAKRSLSSIGAACDGIECRNYDPSNTSSIWAVVSTSTPDDASVPTPRIWVKTVYGICVNAECKGN